MFKSERNGYLQGKQALLLDMNSTFMFGVDRFDDKQDYSLAYQQLGGKLSPARVNALIRKTYAWLDVRYPDPGYRQAFPSVPEALVSVADEPLSQEEIHRLSATFAAHERGHIPADHVRSLQQLRQYFRLGLVIDIWSPKASWLRYFREIGIDSLFEAMSFSSDHGQVKPSPFGFEQVLRAMQLQADQVLFVGDSLRRDLGGAKAVGMDCILVGGAQSARLRIAPASIINN